jgi:hypothetical protein
VLYTRIYKGFLLCNFMDAMSGLLGDLYLFKIQLAFLPRNSRRLFVLARKINEFQQNIVTANDVGIDCIDFINNYC